MAKTGELLPGKTIDPDACQSVGKIRVHHHLAGIPGTGPKGKTCGHCAALDKTQRCVLWKQMMAKIMGRRPPRHDPVPTTTPACNHFIQPNSIPALQNKSG